MKAAVRRQWRRTRLAIAAIAALDVAVLGTGAYLLLNRSETTPVGLDEALADFRDTATTVADGTATVPVTAAPAVIPLAEQPLVPGQPSTAGADDPPPGAPAPAVGIDAPPVTEAADAAVGSARPAAGVYAYRTSGGERVSLLDADHRYPSVTYATVTHGAGCDWRIRADVIREHVDERDVCSEPGRLLQRSQRREVEFFNVREGGTFVCRPALLLAAAGEAVGATSRSTCDDGAGTSATMERTYLGREQATVDGTPIDVVRIRTVATMTGRIRGTAVDDLLLVAATGLPVVWEREVDTIADADFGARVHYVEAARFELQSLEPRT